MTTTLANQLPRINLANGGSMQSTRVVTLKSGQQNASSVDARSPGPSIWWKGNDYTERLALAAVSAATVTAMAAVSNAGMSATVRTAGGSMRRRSARLSAAAAAETTGARRA
jgi:hypothetical protein